jgi:predicted Zn-dependent protease
MHLQHRFVQLRVIILLAVLPALGLTATGCGQPVTNLVTGEQQRGAYTWQQEVQIGQENHPQVVAFFGLYDEQNLGTYVRELGQSVLETSAWALPETPAEIRATPFHFYVLDADMPNAMALPGGYIYVTRGLMAFLENEAQLAVVLGHEIGHVLARHHSRRAAQQQLGQAGLLGAAILGGIVGGGRVAQGILDIGGTAAQLLFLSHSRDAEREADLAGVAYAEFAGYDAAQAASFFGSLRRLGERQGSIPSFLATHPDPAERQQTIPQLSAQHDPKGTAVNRDEYLNRINNIVIGENPRVGYTQGNTFHHPELRFRFNFPQGWRLTNSASAVQMAEPNGRAIMQFTFAQETTAQAAGQTFARQQGVRVTEQGALQVQGNRAYAVAGTAATQQGEIGFIAYFIEHGGNVYQFLGMTAANAMGTYRNQFLQSLNSFQTETDPQVLNRQPVRLEVVRVQQATPFANLLQGRPMPPGMSQNDLAIMNEVELNTTIPAGRTVKLPRQ